MRAKNGWLVHLLVMGISLAFTVIPVMAQETKERKNDAGKTEGPIPLEELRVREPLYRQTPPDFPGTVNIIPQEEIERLKPAHVGEVLQRIPGVTYVDEDGRGFKPGEPVEPGAHQPSTGSG